jgi:isoamylase
MASWSRIEGSPEPLGATWLDDEQCFNFALFSRHATSVTLLLYHSDDLINPVLRIALDYLIHKSGRTWHCRLAIDKIGGVGYYAYSIEGPNNPSAEFHAFDPDKVLLDPYARSIFFHRTFGAAPPSDAVPMLAGLLWPFCSGAPHHRGCASERSCITRPTRSFTKCT